MARCCRYHDRPRDVVFSVSMLSHLSLKVFRCCWSWWTRYAGLCVICMKLTVVQSASNNSSRQLVRSSNHWIRCHPRSSSFPSKNLHMVSSKISTAATEGRIREVLAKKLRDPRRSSGGYISITFIGHWRKSTSSRTTLKRGRGVYWYAEGYITIISFCWNSFVYFLCIFNTLLCIALLSLCFGSACPPLTLPQLRYILCCLLFISG